MSRPFDGNSAFMYCLYITNFYNISLFLGFCLYMIKESQLTFMWGWSEQTTQREISYMDRERSASCNKTKLCMTNNKALFTSPQKKICSVFGYNMCIKMILCVFLIIRCYSPIFISEQIVFLCWCMSCLFVGGILCARNNLWNCGLS